MLGVSEQEVALGNAGNNNVYDDYYFKQGTTGMDNRLSVKPGSNYYFQEETKGKFKVIFAQVFPSYKGSIQIF